ncbi:hypothetical protein THRCLA_00577 [Thraustotheca clavata]|uniref:E3 ubiquitin-protein ligase CHIP n=1 Tax=Thraustotheca clavata TaxID=74557 RepID=A0A1W0AAT6_9STRA|nr:hypothetical protein THRCLA_00577 [Thraustotheca clavata]
MDQATMMKDRGNACYKKGKYSAAVDCYTEAICLSASVPAFYTNRALCYLHLERWIDAQNDCKKAIELDDSNAKAYYLLGKAYSGAGEFGRGVKSLEKSLEKSQTKAPNAAFQDDVLQQLRRAKKAKWLQLQAVQAQRHNRVKSFFAGMLETSRQSNLRASSTNEEQTRVHEEHDLVMAHMMELIESSANLNQQSEIPEYFLCPIGMDIMLDPVTTPNGVSYERKWIEQHLSVQQIDPLTREKLVKSQLRPNVALRQAIEDYLHKHPWAYEE